MMETFCKGFLLRHTEYKYLHVIIDNYRDKYQEIELNFFDKDSFTEQFPAICRTLLQLKGDGQSYIIALLGFAFHVHTTCQDTDWYEFDIMLKTLKDILICINFTPNRSFCSIL